MAYAHLKKHTSKPVFQDLLARQTSFRKKYEKLKSDVEKLSLEKSCRNIIKRSKVIKIVGNVVYVRF